MHSVRYNCGINESTIVTLFRKPGSKVVEAACFLVTLIQYQLLRGDLYREIS